MTGSLCHLSATQIVFPFVKVAPLHGRRRRIVSQVVTRRIRFTNQTNAPVTLTIQAAAMWLSCSFEGAGRTVHLTPFGSAELEIALNDAELGGLNEGSTVGQITVLSSPTDEIWKMYVTLRLHLDAGEGSIPTTCAPLTAALPIPTSPIAPQSLLFDTVSPIVPEIRVEGCTLREYSFEDQAQLRILRAQEGISV